jgi:hypothetical protein
MKIKISMASLLIALFSIWFMTLGNTDSRASESRYSKSASDTKKSKRYFRKGVSGEQFAARKSRRRSSRAKKGEVKKTAKTKKKIQEPIKEIKGSEVIDDRWRILYKKNLIDPYNQNVLKGDYPVIGQDKFFVFRADSISTLQWYGTLPTPSGVATDLPSKENFFGSSRNFIYNQDFRFTFEFFKGESAFRPRDWELRLVPQVNFNHVNFEERGAVNVDPRDGTSRSDNHLALQEASFEYHLADLSRYYDFISLKSGIQIFNADFRGIVFEDANLGVRLLGNADKNFWQYNVVYFDMLEKDTNSQLNTFSDRDQQIVVANLYKQDFLIKGYTAEINYLWNNDGPSQEFDTNRFLVRPDPVGGVTQHQVEANYFGFSGDGHWGRFNVNHFFYYVFGQDSVNPISDQPVDIEAMAAGAEISIDQDWIRYRFSYLYGSGDDDATDDQAEGFDAIFPNPNFAGGRNGYWVSQAIPLAGTGVQLVNQNSIFPSMKSNKIQGQSNFVNPGIHFYNVGVDMNLTPKLRTTINASYLEFDETSAIELIQNQSPISEQIGYDLSLGVEWRPWLNNNVIIDIGASSFIPELGFKELLVDEELYAVTSKIILTY